MAGPNQPAERILNDLLKRKTWLVWDGETAGATITIDIDQPTGLDAQPVWPEHNDTAQRCTCGESS